MASGSITAQQADGENVETLSVFIFFSSKISADSDCSHEIKRRLLPGRKGFPGSSAGKESTCSAADPGSIPDWEDPLEKE